MSLNWADVKEDTPLASLSTPAAAPATSPAPAAAAASPPPAAANPFATAAFAAPSASSSPPAAASSPPAASAAVATSPSPPAAGAAAPAGASSSGVSSQAPGGASVEGVAAELSKTTLATEADAKADDEVQVAAFSGLHPNDNTAQVSVTLSAADEAAAAAALSGGSGASGSSTGAGSGIYRAVATFDELGLSKELLSGVYAMKFTTPSKIQAQALPIIMAPNRPNLIGQAHHGSGKCWAPGTPMMLWDGRVRPVEHIKANDVLMGDDSTPRRVQEGSVIQGQGQMFEVRSLKGEHARDAWRCNEDHILVLAMVAAPRIVMQQTTVAGGEASFELQRCELQAGSSSDSTVPCMVRVSSFTVRTDAEVALQSLQSTAPVCVEFEITVHDFLSLDPELQTRCRMFAPELVHFPAEVEASATLMQRAERACGVPVSAAALRGIAFALGSWLATAALPDLQPLHAELALDASGFEAGFRALLHAYAMDNDQHLPLVLISTSAELRRALLAGLLSAAGRQPVAGTPARVQLKASLCAEGVLLLARSLGHAAGLERGGEEGVQRVWIAGVDSATVMSIDILLDSESDVCMPISTQSSFARGFPFSISPVGLGVFHGFTLDGNGRCLLGDGTITHNTATFSLGALSRVDQTNPNPQILILCPTRELAIQVSDVLKSLAQYTRISILAVVPSAERRAAREPIQSQVVVGTPGTIDSRIANRDLDVRGITLFVADEADQMIAQEGQRDKTVLIKKRLPKSSQILLFSATFDEDTRKFAKVVAPNAVEIMVKTEELSLDGIKQYFMDCRDEQDKYKALTEIFSLLEIGQSIIFVHTVATAKTLANRMRADGYTVSLLHGKDMLPQERDRVMSDFRSNKTSVLITTNVLARGIDVLSVTLVVNFDLPLNRHMRPDPETYIHRIGRSGRFGRKGVAINFVHDNVSRQNLAFIAAHFKKNIVSLPRDDLEKITALIQKDLQ